MARVFLGIGSNIGPEDHVRSGILALACRFHIAAISSVYESASIGFAGNDFYNLVVEVSTGLAVGELQAVLREIEEDNGCLRCTGLSSSRTLDIDILIYDQLVGCIDGVVLPREEILFNAFVLWPLAEIAGQLSHPVRNKTYQVLWDEFDKTKQAIQLIDFVLPLEICQENCSG